MLLLRFVLVFRVEGVERSSSCLSGRFLERERAGEKTSSQCSGAEEEDSSQMGKHFVFCGFAGHERG